MVVRERFFRARSLTKRGSGGHGSTAAASKYYFEGILPLLPNMTFKMVNTASFDQDLRCALRWLGFPAEVVDAFEYEDQHSVYPSKNETVLSSKGRSNLKSFLIDDYFILDELYKYADSEC